jgi:hypothetical protein
MSAARAAGTTASGASATTAYARLRQSVAAALYVRNRMAGEVLALGAAVVRLRAHAASPRASAGARAELTAREDDLRRAERDLAVAQEDAREAMASLHAAHAALRAEARQRLRGRATDLAIEVASEREAMADPLEDRFRELARR